MARTTGKQRASGQIGAATSVSRPIQQDDNVAPTRVRMLVERLARWDVALAGFAWLAWFAGHFAGLADLAIPAWVLSGLALGVLRPRFGLILTILVVPYLGGAGDLGQAETLRVVPVLGAASRVALDRLFGVRTPGAPRGEMVVLALVASGLFLLTALTAFLPAVNPGILVLAAAPWLIGAPVAFLAAWIVAAHQGGHGDDAILDTVLISTVAACLFAFAAWAGLSWTGPFAYAADVGGRLGALGYPTPTAMAVAVAVPFAVVAAHRRHIVLSAVVLAIGLGAVAATGSRGALLALAAGAFVATAASGRLSVRVATAGALVAIVGAAGVLFVRYRDTPDPIAGAIAQMIGTDTLRVQSWWAAVDITARNPLMGGGWLSLSRVPEFGSVDVTSSHNLFFNAFADGGLPLGITFGFLVLHSTAMMWWHRRTIASYAIAAATTLLVTGLWDIPNLRSYGAVMGGLALGIVARTVTATPEAGEPRASKAERRAAARRSRKR